MTKKYVVLTRFLPALNGVNLTQGDVRTAAEIGRDVKALIEDGTIREAHGDETKVSYIEAQDLTIKPKAQGTDEQAPPVQAAEGKGSGQGQGGKG